MIQLDLNMKMPDKCSECRFFRVESQMYCTAVVGYTTVSKPYKRRPAWCPLHEITDSDTISRYAVIDALGDTRAFYFDSDKGMVRATKEQTGYEGWYKVHDVFRTIDNIPPSPEQPEPKIIFCKDCKHHHHENGIPYCNKNDYGYGWKDADFCSYAERK